jgi:hypothetical protein
VPYSACHMRLLWLLTGFRFSSHDDYSSSARKSSTDLIPTSDLRARSLTPCDSPVRHLEARLAICAFSFESVTLLETHIFTIFYPKTSFTMSIAGLSATGLAPFFCSRKGNQSPPRIHPFLPALLHKVRLSLQERATDRF